MPFFSPCGLLFGSHEHHLDHMAPLCCLLDIPLIITEKQLLSLAQTFYPSTQFIYMNPNEVGSKLLQTFNAVISPFPKPFLEALFFPISSFFSIWCPHGQSDKGEDTFYFEALKNESVIFAYGEKMYHLFQKKKILSSSCSVFFLGNYRYDYFKKHKKTYFPITEKTLFTKLSKTLPIFFYAPTWKDGQGYSSYETVLPTLIETLPKDHQLLVKLHPNTVEKNETKTQKLLSLFENHPHVLFLENFPSIYPLLNHCEAYIGDASSIGYDALYLEKPLFLIKQQGTLKNLPLYNYSTLIHPSEISTIYEKILRLTFSFEKKESSQIFMHHAFSKTPNYLTLKFELSQLFKQRHP